MESSPEVLEVWFGRIFDHVSQVFHHDIDQTINMMSDSEVPERESRMTMMSYEDAKKPLGCCMGMKDGWIGERLLVTYSTVEFQ